jgi:tetratricopeptide (TPR) repeat protein
MSPSLRRYGLRRFIAGAFVLALPLGSVAALEKEEDEQGEAEEVNYVDLAAKMIADGHYDRAEEMLAGVDPEQAGVDRVKLFTLRGIVYLKKQLFQAAAEAFEAAIAAGQKEPVVRLYLAQSYFGTAQYDECLKALDAAGSAAASVEEAHLMRGRSHWELGHKAESIAALNVGLDRYPTSPLLQRARIFFLVELGLYQEVVAASASYLSRADVTEDDYVAVGEALRAGKQLTDAQRLLEGALLRFPESEKLALQLAHCYLDDGKPAAAALVFEHAARASDSGKYYLEAAESYKQGQRLERALSLNARIPDQKSKVKQRLSLLLAQEEFEQVATLSPVLSRLNLLADDDIRYALAYAYFNTGQLDLAEQQAKSIRQSKLFDASVELRRAIDTCRRSGWECRR